MTCIGPDALEIHTGLTFPSEDDRQNIDKGLELWQNYCIGKTTVIYERYRFNNRLQESDDSIDAYTTALRTLAETCEFGSLKEDLIPDRLVCDIRDNSLRKKLLQEPKLTLDKCLDSCRAAEATTLQMQAMTNQKQRIKRCQRTQIRTSQAPVWLATANSVTSLTKEIEKSVPPSVKSARSARKRITSLASVIFMRRKLAQKKKKPKASKSSSKETSRKKVSFVETDLSSEDEILSVDLSTEDDNVSTSEVINSVTDFPNKIYALMEIQGKPVQIQIDSGASCNVLPKKYLPGVSEIQKANKLLTAYNKQLISALGTARVSMRNPRTRKKYNAEFVVVDGNYTPLIGARAAQQMGLLVVQHHNIQLVSNNEALTTSQSSPLTKAQVLTDFADIFKGLGRMEGKLHLEVDDSVSPVVMTHRRVPVAVKGKFKEEIDRLLERAASQPFRHHGAEIVG